MKPLCRCDELTGNAKIVFDAILREWRKVAKIDMDDADFMHGAYELIDAGYAVIVELPGAKGYRVELTAEGKLLFPSLVAH